MSDNKYLRYPAVLRKFIPLFEKWKGWLNQGVNTTDSPNFAGLTVGGNTVWHAGNDGAGSGLDADTLDGMHVRDIVLFHDITRNVGGSAWYKILSITLADVWNATVIKVDGYSNTVGLGGRGHFSVIAAATSNSDPVYSRFSLVYLGRGMTPNLFSLRVSEGVASLYFQMPQYTSYRFRVTTSRAVGGEYPTFYSSLQENPIGTEIPIELWSDPKLLWSGAWSSGNISAAGIHLYSTFLIKTTAQAQVVVRAARVPGDTLVLGDGWWGGLQVMASFFTYTDGATFEGCASKGHPASAVHGAAANYTITAIYGVT